MTCKKCRKRLLEAVYHELPAQEQTAFDAHVAKCDACAQELQHMQNLLALMDQRQRPEPAPAYWDSFWARLAPQLETPSPPARRHWRHRLLDPLIRPSGWGIRLAAAAALLLIGIFIGKWAFGDRSHLEPADGISTHIDATLPAAVEQRSQRYLERSKILLLGMVNFEPASDQPYPPGLAQKQMLSRELLSEAQTLKDDLADSRQQRLYKLVSDIEFILLQIANMEAESDIPAVELVRSSVERNGIMLKINLEEIRQSARQETPLQPAKDENKNQHI